MFASLLAVVLMIVVSVYVVAEAIGRIGHHVEVSSGPMLVVGALGLAVNLVALMLLRSGAAESLNVKGAYLEVVADTAELRRRHRRSAGWSRPPAKPIWDTVIALAIGVFVAARAISLGRQVFAVLGQHVPEGIDSRRRGPGPVRHRRRPRRARPAPVDADVRHERRHRPPGHRRPERQPRGAGPGARPAAPAARRGARHLAGRARRPQRLRRTRLVTRARGADAAPIELLRPGCVSRYGRALPTPPGTAP
ncbi:cation transporter [Nonomuraea ferruginea]